MTTACTLAVMLITSAAAEVILTPTEIDQTLAHGPWPMKSAADPSNRVSGNPSAISMGKDLFSDPLLSRDGSMSCATCHDPKRDFSDAEPRAKGRILLDRNTPSLNNLRAHRWFGWGGTSDTIWGQSILPILNPDELNNDGENLKRSLQSSVFAEPYETLFGTLADQPPQHVLVNVAKALGAYQETITTGQTSFDRFRDALESGDMKAASAYPEPAQRGLQIFLGRGRCVFCHSGPAFTNAEFHDVAIPYFIEPGRVDGGRHAGLKQLLNSPYTLDGAFNDDPKKAGAWALRNVRSNHANFGIFRVPSLRGASRTAPYMHDGSIADLEAVVAHYNQINTERLHADGEAILEPLELNTGQVGDLVKFLHTLGDDRETASTD
ncbi:MAG: cytochrome c peroxidase [Rhizobiaceae bacterium]